MFRRMTICSMLCVGVWAQQLDKPTAQDLADQRDSARAERASKLKVIGEAANIIRRQLGPDLGDDPKAEAPFIHLRLMECFVKGDYSRRASKIYVNAADAAFTAAKEIDAKAGVSMASPPEATEARQNLDEAIRRDAELRGKPALNGVEKVELDGLPAFENQLRETIAIYERIEKSHPTAARAGDLARQMREKEAFFRVKVKQADANTKFFNAQCVDERSQLRWIEQVERGAQLLHQYDRLTEGQAAPKDAADKGSGAAAPKASEGQSDAERLKEDERILSDPDEMLRRANRLKQLSGQGTSN
jgi:hypothetical protein